MEVIGEAENGRKALKMAEKIRPNVVIMDVTMPDMNGIEAARKIVTEVPGVKVIALSMHSDRRFVLGMLESGRVGLPHEGLRLRRVGQGRPKRCNRVRPT